MTKLNGSTSERQWEWEAEAVFIIHSFVSNVEGINQNENKLTLLLKNCYY